LIITHIDLAAAVLDHSTASVINSKKITYNGIFRDLPNYLAPQPTNSVETIEKALASEKLYS